MRIAGATIPDEKQTKISLTYIYGIGRTLAQELLEATKIDPAKKAKDLTSEEINKLQGALEKYQTEGELRQTKRSNINRLKDIGVYRGLRHAKSLPSRGQRTKSNSRTVRGNVRKTAGSGKRKVELK